MTERIPLDDLTSDQLDQLYDRLAKAEQEADVAVAAAAQLTILVGKRSEKAEKDAATQRQRAETFETELHILRSGLRANGADPTQIQNLWAQIRLRNRQWREAKHRHAQAEDLLRVAHETSNRSEAERARAVTRAERAEAAIDRVRALADRWERDLPERVRIPAVAALRNALDQTQPTA